VSWVYKLACLNWCCQLLNNCPASMVNSDCFTDGKLLPFYHCSHKNRPKRLVSHSCWNSLTSAADYTFQQDGAPAHRDCEMVEFLACERFDFKLPCRLLLTRLTFFNQRTRLSSPSKQCSNWQHQLRQASLYSRHIMTSSLRHDWQRIFNQQPYFVKIFWISISSATTGKKFYINCSSFEWIMK